jgi:hypothetical protein
MSVEKIMLIWIFICVTATLIYFRLRYYPKKEPNHFLWFNEGVHMWDGKSWIKCKCSDIKVGDIIHDKGDEVE